MLAHFETSYVCGMSVIFFEQFLIRNLLDLKLRGERATYQQLLFHQIAIF